MQVYPASTEVYTTSLNNPNGWRAPKPIGSILLPHSGSNSITLGPFGIADFTRIAGIVKSDKSLTVTVNQGFDSSDLTEKVDTINVVGGTPASFNVQTVGREASITITNVDSADSITGVKLWASARAF